MLDQTVIALRGAESEGQPRLHNEIKPLLELVGHAEVPHGQGNEHAVSEQEAHRQTLDDGESITLRVAERPATETRIFGFERGAIELGQRFAPQVLEVDVPRRPRLAKFRQERLGRCGRRRTGAWRAPQMEELRHRLCSHQSRGATAHPSALMTASAFVTTATFCMAKSMEARCHAAFIVEQQSSGTTMK
jgi:hypothetical protein